MWFPPLSVLFRPIHRDEAPREDATPTDPIVLGVWAGMSSLLNPKRDIAFCVAHRFSSVTLIVNDHSAWRAPSTFDLYDVGKISRFCSMAKDAGLAVHLMSWIMPHRPYIERAASLLVPLFNTTGARSIQWDAEEPWTKASSPLDYAEAAALVGELFPIRMGVNGIGYTPVEKFGPLAAVCDYLVPQCYATSTSGANPSSVVATYMKRWRAHFGSAPVVAGLAAYRQSGIPGFTPSQAIRAAFDGAVNAGVHEVTYWSLASIMRDATVAKAIRSLQAPVA